MTVLHWKPASHGLYPEVSQNDRPTHCTDAITPYWKMDFIWV